MNGKVLAKVFSNGILVGSMLLALLLAGPSYGEVPGNPKDVDVTTEDLKELVDLLENSQRRETLVKDLKNLIRVREAEGMGKPPKKKEVLAIEKGFASFASLFKGVLDAGASTVS